MSRVGIFIDTCDLYHKVQRSFSRGSKVCFDRYLDYVDGDTWSVGIAYGMRSSSGAFPTFLESLGFTTKFKPPRVYSVGDRTIKKCDWNVALAMDVVRAVADYNLDTVIIGSSNALLLPVVTYLKECGVNVVILASGIPDVLRKTSDEYIELDETYLEEARVENEVAK